MKCKFKDNCDWNFGGMAAVGVFIFILSVVGTLGFLATSSCVSRASRLEVKQIDPCSHSHR
jgi:hypothetical protein